jgi:hypothetical protein
MTDAVEIAWLAGIFEGEGSVGISWPTRTNRPYVQARIGMTDLDVLEHVQRVAGGRLKGPYTRNRRKPMYTGTSTAGTRWSASATSSTRG